MAQKIVDGEYNSSRDSPSKSLRGWNSNNKNLQRVNLRGLRVGFYPSKRDQGKLSIRFW